MFQPKSGKSFKWQGVKFQPAGKDRWEHYNIFTQKSIVLKKIHTAHYETYEIIADNMTWWHYQYEVALAWALNKKISNHTIEKYHPKLTDHSWNNHYSLYLTCKNCGYNLDLTIKTKQKRKLPSCKEQQIKSIIV